MRPRGSEPLINACTFNFDFRNVLRRFLNACQSECFANQPHYIVAVKMKRGKNVRFLLTQAKIINSFD